MLHLIDICFLPCICLWQISEIQTCLCVVVGHGFVSTSPVFMRNSASHLAGPHDRLAQNNGKSGPHCWEREVSTQFAQQLVTGVTASLLVGGVVWSHICLCIIAATRLLYICTFCMFPCSDLCIFQQFKRFT